MATAFRIHEDIENVLDAAHKKDHHPKVASINIGKTENKLEKQPLRPTFAILNNVTNDSGRNITATTTHAQKTVRKQQQPYTCHSNWNSAFGFVFNFIAHYFSSADVLSVHFDLKNPNSYMRVKKCDVNIDLSGTLHGREYFIAYVQ